MFVSIEYPLAQEGKRWKSGPCNGTGALLKEQSHKFAN